MTRRRVAIVGASLAGGRAAEGLRQLGFDGDILLIGSEPDPPYERPPLSKQILWGDMPEDGPLLRSRASWEELGIELVLGSRVESIDTSARTLHLSTGDALQADQVLLCTGSRPRRLPVQGAAQDGVIHLRDLAQAAELRDRLGPGSSVVVVGGGLIGAEVAAAATRRGCQTTIIEADDLPLRRVLGPDLARTMLSVQRRHGVDVRLRATPEIIEGHGRVEAVRLTSGERLPATVVVVGIGVVPETDLAEQAGAHTDNGVVVDESCRTTVDGIFAAGDVTSHPSPLFGRRLRLESWDHAQRHGVAAAGALLGSAEPYDTVPWFWSDQHDINLQIAGLPTLADERVHRGDPATESFCEFGLQGGRLVSVTGCNRAKDVRRTLPLIAARIHPDSDQLRDESFDLRQLRPLVAS